MVGFTEMVLVTAAAGAATGIGAVPVLFQADVSHRIYDTALGLASGIMLGASVFGLIIPGMEDGPLAEVMLGVVLGGFGLLVANRLLPHIHGAFIGWRRHGEAVAPLDESSPLRRAALVGGSIALHNAPEGLAMGIAFAAELDEVAYVLAVMIALQNIPDGFAFAVPLGTLRIHGLTIVALTTASGLVPEVLAATLGYSLVSVAAEIFPIAAGFAAGTMIAVVFRELVPSSHGHGYADAATAAFLVGFTLLVLIDSLLVI